MAEAFWPCAGPAQSSSSLAAPLACGAGPPAASRGQVMAAACCVCHQPLCCPAACLYCQHPAVLSCPPHAACSGCCACPAVLPSTPHATHHHWPALSLQHIDWGFVIKSQHYGTAVFTIAYLIILACVHWLADSRRTPIFLYDASIAYPYKSDTIPAVAAVLVPFALLILSMLAYEFFVYRKVGSLALCKLRVAQPVCGASRHQGQVWRRMWRHLHRSCCFYISYICTSPLSAGWPWCKGSCVFSAYDTFTERG